jgi:hypothetical protein
MQCEEWAPVWAHLRDHAKPVQPRDVWDLREVRDMGAPTSKAHVKRIQRLSARPAVTTAHARPDPDHAHRLRANRRAAAAKPIADLVRKANAIR